MPLDGNEFPQSAKTSERGGICSAKMRDDDSSSPYVTSSPVSQTAHSDSGSFYLIPET
jgi:hypothetical protein